MPFRQSLLRLRWALPSGLICAAFATDLALPRTTVGHLGYLIPAALASLPAYRERALRLGLAISAPAIVGFALAATPGRFWDGVASRALLLAVVWLLAMVARRVHCDRAVDGMQALVGLCSEVADGMILVVGPAGTVEHANTAACDIVGLDARSIRGRSFLDELVPESSRGEARDALERVMAGEQKSVRLESRLLGSTGEERIVRWRWTRVGDGTKRAMPAFRRQPAGQAYRARWVVGWGTDVTERRRARAEFLERAALARLGEMAAVVAHEVRNPLAGIRGAVEVLGERLADADEGRAVVAEILSRVEGLERLVDEMLVFARPRPLCCEAIRVRPLIEEVLRLVQGDPSLARLRIDVAGPDATIVADPVLVRQLFVNVLLNAAQASPPGGSVRIVLDVVAGWCLVTISDEGPGVPDELREKIFEPFFTTKHRGSGLGLPIAWRAAQLHGGQITLRRPPIGGTTIEVRLPSQPTTS